MVGVHSTLCVILLPTGTVESNRHLTPDKALHRYGKVFGKHLAIWNQCFPFLDDILNYLLSGKKMMQFSWSLKSPEMDGVENHHQSPSFNTYMLEDQGNEPVSRKLWGWLRKHKVCFSSGQSPAHLRDGRLRLPGPHVSFNARHSPGQNKGTSRAEAVFLNCQLEHLKLCG
jgi:hypothetical protein